MNDENSWIKEGGNIAHFVATRENLEQLCKAANNRKSHGWGDGISNEFTGV